MLRQEKHCAMDEILVSNPHCCVIAKSNSFNWCGLWTFRRSTVEHPSTNETTELAPVDANSACTSCIACSAESTKKHLPPTLVKTSANFAAGSSYAIQSWLRSGSPVSATPHRLIRVSICCLALTGHTRLAFRFTTLGK
jgi:hypothetical protein